MYGPMGQPLPPDTMTSTLSFMLAVHPLALDEQRRMGVAVPENNYWEI